MDHTVTWVQSEAETAGLRDAVKCLKGSEDGFAVSRNAVSWRECRLARQLSMLG
ncbi:MAG: hypothetical protein ACU84H_01810 [Gammaproteobacteria bacterium]